MVHKRRDIKGKMKIGIDIDEVIVEFVRGYLELYEKKYGKKILFEDIFSYNLWEPLKISKEEIIKLADEFQIYAMLRAFPQFPLCHQLPELYLLLSE